MIPVAVGNQFAQFFEGDSVTEQYRELPDHLTDLWIVELLILLNCRLPVIGLLQMSLSSQSRQYRIQDQFRFFQTIILFICGRHGCANTVSMQHIRHKHTISIPVTGQTSQNPCSQNRIPNLSPKR